MQLIAASTDTAEVHLAWIKTARNRGGLGYMQIPILSDVTKVGCRARGNPLLLPLTWAWFDCFDCSFARHIVLNRYGVDGASQLYESALELPSAAKCMTKCGILRHDEAT